MSSYLSIIIKTHCCDLFHNQAVALIYNLVRIWLLLVAIFGTVPLVLQPKLAFSSSEQKQTSQVLYLKIVHLFCLITFYKLYMFIFTNTTFKPWTPKFTKYKEEVHYLAIRKDHSIPDIFQLEFWLRRHAWERIIKLRWGSRWGNIWCGFNEKKKIV